jgi:hypothetical protein
MSNEICWHSIDAISMTVSEIDAVKDASNARF